MQELKMNGTIKWFDKTKGYGYIIGADESLYYFEQSSGVNAKEIYTTGETVEFIPNFGDLDYALKVEKKEKTSL
ncbi:MAG: hypothetical protein E7161_01625 [Firmicutes bacterium]|nr:hypothetical protein [Bacillota bacterium]